MAKQSARNLTLVAIGLLIGFLLPQAWSTLAIQAQTGGCQTFPQTGHKVCGRFLQYWSQRGGLAQQGYPLSEEFVETSELNGKPYTVQYFERAVFELHPENRPPNDVLLSQLGTFQGKRLYSKGFPTAPAEVPFYEDRAAPENVLKSYYNAINRKEYDRAYSYFEGAPNPAPSLAPPFNQFVAGYADTLSVTLEININSIQVGAAAGSIYATIPVVLTASHKDGTRREFAGNYVVRRTNTGISPDPNATLWRIYSADLAEMVYQP